MFSRWKRLFHQRFLHKRVYHLQSCPGQSGPGNLHWFCQGMSGSGSVNKTASILHEMLKVFANISYLIVRDRIIY